MRKIFRLDCWHWRRTIFTCPGATNNLAVESLSLLKIAAEPSATGKWQSAHFCNGKMAIRPFAQGANEFVELYNKASAVSGMCLFLCWLNAGSIVLSFRAFLQESYLGIYAESNWILSENTLFYGQCQPRLSRCQTPPIHPDVHSRSLSVNPLSSWHCP